MSVPVARRTAEFAFDFDFFENIKFASEACREIYEFLADSSRSRRLPVSARHHRNSFVVTCQSFNLFNHFPQSVADNFLTFFNHQSVGSVVDVLRSAAEVNPLLQMSQAAVFKLILDVVFNRFHIVVRNRFELFDHKTAFGVETGVDRIDCINNPLRRIVETELGKNEFKPLDFDKNTVLYETVFRKNIPEFVGMFGVSSVNNRNRVQTVHVSSKTKFAEV